MYFLRSGIPFVRFLIVFMLGVFSGIHMKLILPILILYILIFLYGLLVYLEKRKLHQFYLKSLVAYMLLLTLGVFIVNERTDKNKKDHYLHFLDHIEGYKARVISTPIYTEKTIKVILEVATIKTATTTWKNSNGKLIAYILRDSFVVVEKGDVLVINGKPDLPPKVANPYQFDYANYLSLQNSYSIHFFSKNQYIKIENKPSCWLIQLADNFRRFCEEKLKAGIKGENEYSLSKALLLGISSRMDEKISEAYSATGTVHALAVSGLHVSLLYFIIVFVFGSIKRINYGKYIFVVLSISAFWFYALVTGFSPSVVRAVTMFSIFLLSGILKRNSSIYNTLAFSAFIILCVEPFWLLDIGFQFSFLAVVGIAYIYPILYSWVEPKNIVMDKLWALICVSMAAQIAVAPLSIYYFHSFPLLFLPFNMLIVPLSSLALYTGLAGLLLYKITFLSTLAFLITEYIARFMNYSVQLPSELTFLKIDYLFIEKVDLFLIYLFMILLFFSIKNRRYKMFVYASICFFILTFSIWYSTSLKSKEISFTLYTIKGKTVASLIHNGNAIVLSDELLTSKDKNFRYSIYNHLSYERIEAIRFSRFDATSQLAIKQYPFGQFFVWQGLKILRVKNEIGEEELVDFLEICDILIISNNELYKSIRKNKLVSSSIVLIDSSIKEKPSEFSEGFYDVRSRGAFLIAK